MLKGVDIWAQGFGSYLHEDPRDISGGYDATIWGTALGFDLPVFNDNLRLGLSGGFAQDFIRSKDNSGRNDVNNYQGTAYGIYAKDAYYIDAAFAFAYNTYDSTRHVSFGGFDRIPKGDYSGQQYSGYVEGGYTVKYKKLGVTPLASFQYMHLHIDNYTETDGGGADLHATSQDYDLAQTGLGVKADYPFTTQYGTLIPELRFKWLYDWVGDAQQQTSTFTGGGGAFATNGFSPAQSSFDIGAKLTLLTKNNLSLSVNYDLQLQDDLYGHYGYAEARYSF
jgi:outer membrane autotransporter protein